MLVNASFYINLSYTQWNIQFVEDHRNQDDFIRQRLNERLFDKIQKIEMKKLKEDKEMAKAKKMSKDARRKSEFDKRMAQGRKKGVISNVFHRSIILELPKLWQINILLQRLN